MSGSVTNGSAPPASSTRAAFEAALRSRDAANNYIAHLKIWESDESGAAPKARYLVIAVQKDSGRVTLNKAKRNANGSYSIGKDWDLNALREVEVHDPTTFTITLARAYKWQTEHSREQELFLQNMVRVFRKYTGQHELPRLVGWEYVTTSPVASTSASTSTTPAPISEPTRATTPNARSITPNARSATPNARSITPASVSPSIVSTLPPTSTTPEVIAEASADLSSERLRARRPGLSSASGSISGPAGAAIAPGLAPSANLETNEGNSEFSSDRLRVRRPGLSHSSSTGPGDRALPEKTSPAAKPPASRSPSRNASDAFYDPRSAHRPVVGRPISPEKSRADGRSPNGPERPGLRRKDSEGGASLLNGVTSASAHVRADGDDGFAEAVGLSNAASNGREAADAQEASSAIIPTSAPGRPPRASLLLQPNRPPKNRSNSNSSITSNSLGVPSGNARSRLSSVEPVRGGAAYERMLLAGTGLTNFAEDDEDGGEQENEEGGEHEDPYGGTVVANAPSWASPRSVRSRLADSKSIGEKSPASIQRKLGAGDSSTALPELMDDEDTTLLNVEEILEGFEWNGKPSAAGSGALGLRNGSHITAIGGKGTADVIEARLLDELAALEAANIHAIIESDDRINLVIGHLDEALLELDRMDGLMATYKASLNARADDISHIESQNRGLQVQTSNQRVLAIEIETLLSTIHVDEDALAALTLAPLEDDEGIAILEGAAAALYKSILQAHRDDSDGVAGAAEMAAMTERLGDYTAHSDRFCTRLHDYLESLFNEQTHALLFDASRQAALSGSHPQLQDHAQMEEVLGRYCGLLLYMKELSPTVFSRVSAAYFASASEAYKAEMSRVFASLAASIRVASEEDIAESSFVSGTSQSTSATAALRSGTIRRLHKDKTSNSAKGKGETAGSEAFQHALAAVTPLVCREQVFISDLLQINDNAVTFADYMDLEPYFRRRAAAIYGPSAPNATASRRAAGPLREMKGALDLIFGFLPPECQSFIDKAIQCDRTQVVGLLAALDRAIVEAEELNNEFLTRAVTRLHMRLASQLESFMAEQVKGIEQTKLTAKKRKGVVPFIKIFPVFVDRVEAQLVNAESLNIRNAIDGYYDQLCGTMFDALQAMAKLISGAAGGGDDDKGQLNHHVILLENMHHLIKAITAGNRTVVPALTPIIRRADSTYHDSLASYVHFVLRRPIGKMMDFGDGIDALLKSTPANEVQLHSAYSKSALKRLLKEYGSKDVRKAIEALSKRLAKHFSDDDEGTSAFPSSHSARSAAEDEEAAEVLASAWKGCEENFTREIERLERILKDCYANAGLNLELGSQDVVRAFQANMPSFKRR